MIFLILLRENNGFKLQLKEFLLISCDKKIYSLCLQLFDLSISLLFINFYFKATIMQFENASSRSRNLF